MSKTITNHMGVLTHYNRALCVSKVEKLDDTALGVYAASEYGLIYLFVKLCGVFPVEPSGAKIFDVHPSFFGAGKNKLTRTSWEAMDPIKKERLRARETEDTPRIVLL